MDIQGAKEKFGLRIPIFKDELKDFFDVQNDNTFNQYLSGLVKFNLINKVENGIYYFPSDDERFKNLKPDLQEIVKRKYLEDYKGIRTGAYLVYKYKLTTQVSTYYEVITNNVSRNTRAKKEFRNNVIVWSSKFQIDKNNYLYAEFLELVNNMSLSDYNYKTTKVMLSNIFLKLKLNKEKTLKFSNYYKGGVHSQFRKRIKEILDEVAWK